MSLFEQIATACRPGPVSRKMYTFSKTGVPMNKEELEKAKIETVIATSFDEVFKERPELATWFVVSITS